MRRCLQQRSVRRFFLDATFWAIIQSGMQEIHLGDQIIRYDCERTRTAYAGMKTGSTQSCGCRFCRNFVAQRNLVYAEQIRQVLDRLGIDPEKEGDLFEEGPEGSLVRYCGWFHLAGEVIQAGERMTDGGAGLQYFFRASYRPRALADFGEEVLVLEFSTKLPWVISDRPEWL
jgi:hypothetical protein